MANVRFEQDLLWKGASPRYRLSGIVCLTPLYIYG